MDFHQKVMFELLQTKCLAVALQLIKSHQALVVIEEESMVNLKNQHLVKLFP